MTELGHDDCHNDVTDGVGGRSTEKKRSSSYSVNNEKGEYTGDQLNDVEDTAHVKLHLVVEAKLLKESRRVVDELMYLLSATSLQFPCIFIKDLQR